MPLKVVVSLVWLLVKFHLHARINASEQQQELTWAGFQFMQHSTGGGGELMASHRRQRTHCGRHWQPVAVSGLGRGGPVGWAAAACLVSYWMPATDRGSMRHAQGCSHSNERQGSLTALA